MTGVLLQGVYNRTVVLYTFLFNCDVKSTALTVLLKIAQICVIAGMRKSLYLRVAEDSKYVDRNSGNCV